MNTKDFGMLVGNGGESFLWGMSDKLIPHMRIIVDLDPAEVLWLEEYGKGRTLPRAVLALLAEKSGLPDRSGPHCNRRCRWCGKVWTDREGAIVRCPNKRCQSTKIEAI